MIKAVYCRFVYICIGEVTSFAEYASSSRLEIGVVVSAVFVILERSLVRQ